jgi:uncharacterized damage-inducible protein DinB
MSKYSTYAKQQYDFVKDSRNMLFEYCKTISEEDFVNQNSSFGRGGSMRSLLVHIANTYEYWIANLTLKQNISNAAYENYKTIHDVIRLFDAVNNFMEEFISGMDQEVNKLQNLENPATPFKLFSHVITHEYHHKGQILSLSRHFGYSPIDTDIMR